MGSHRWQAANSQHTPSCGIWNLPTAPMSGRHLQLIRGSGDSKRGCYQHHLAAFSTQCQPKLFSCTHHGRPGSVVAQVTASPVKSKEVPRKVKLEQHKLVDEAIIVVRSGGGGRGEIVEEGKGRMVRNFKYRAGGQQPKMIWLPAADPAPGADGANVVIYVDPALDNLLHLHERSKYTAHNGAPGNPLLGSSGPQRQSANAKPRTEPLRIPVPPGTVVKRKKGGTLLGELCQPGQQIIVAQGGRGGIGVKKPSQGRQMHASRRKTQSKSPVIEEYELEDENYKVDAQGLPGEEFALQLLLRVVADVGIVGLPNAGKSSLLAALTRATPEVAPYPFTTLTPNLGVLQSGSQDCGDSRSDDKDEYADFGLPGQRQRQSTVLADLPGLIEGAHAGRGLGRMFLRHLRRTLAILHVIDASAADPAADYWVVREELRMYNPEYCARPHVVALNKMDLEDAHELQEEIVSAIQHIAQQLKESNEGVPSLPSAIVPVSATEGKGLTQLSSAIEPLIAEAA